MPLTTTAARDLKALNPADDRSAESTGIRPEQYSRFSPSGVLAMPSPRERKAILLSVENTRREEEVLYVGCEVGRVTPGAYPEAER